MDDFVLIAAAWFLNQQVTTYDASYNIVPDDGSYQQHGAEQVYVFAEFLRDKSLLRPGVSVSRSPDLELRFSDLTDEGQRFSKAQLHKWMQSNDRAPSRPINPDGLEKRWTKFKAAN